MSQRRFLNPWAMISTLVALAPGCGGPDDLGLDPEGEPIGQASADVSGLTCERGVEDDLPLASVNAVCLDPAKAGACATLRSARQTALANCSAGRMRVYRIYNKAANLHWEQQPPMASSLLVVEQQFDFARSPQPGANPGPIYRCLANNEDFLSRSATCEALNKAPLSFKGYSFAAGTTGARAVYRCRRRGTPVDHFLSRDAGCEGHLQEALLGYAK